MGKKAFIGASSKAHQVKKIYLGVSDKARKVKKGFIGVSGKAHQFFSTGFPGGLYGLKQKIDGTRASYISKVDLSTLLPISWVKLSYVYYHISYVSTGGQEGTIAQHLATISGSSINSIGYYTISPETGATVSKVPGTNIDSSYLGFTKIGATTYKQATISKVYSPIVDLYSGSVVKTLDTYFGNSNISGSRPSGGAENNQAVFTASDDDYYYSSIIDTDTGSVIRVIPSMNSYNFACYETFIYEGAINAEYLYKRDRSTYTYISKVAWPDMTLMVRNIVSIA